MLELNYNAPINTMGYGYTGYHFMKNMLLADIDITLFEIGAIEKFIDIGDFLKRSFSQNPRPINNNATTLRIWHQNDIHPRIGKGKHYGFPIFELNKFTKMEKYSMMSCDELIVCSEWAKRVIIENGIKVPISVVPLGYDDTVFTESEIKKTGTTIFLNCGKWEYRKGHDLILESFESCFNEKDNVELWMMCSNPFPYAKGEEWEKRYKNSKLSRKIKLIPRQSSQLNVAKIMSKADCGVFPSRAEGWNLELLEMMGLGKHIITTNYSGHTEFCNKDSANLIDIMYTEPAHDDIWFKGQGEWAHMGKDQKYKLSSYMSHIHHQKQSGVLTTNKAAVVQAKNFTWSKSTHKLINVLSQ
jgi:glycosyltransferase involved in cell wall biosynthesis